MRAALASGLLLSLIAGGCAWSGRAVFESPGRPTADHPLAFNGTRLESPPEPAPAPSPARAPVPAGPPPPAARVTGLVVLLPLDGASAALSEGELLGLEESVRTVAGANLTPRGLTMLQGETTLALLTDNGVDPVKACEASCALSAARELRARLFLSGLVTRSEGAYLAFVRLFDTATGAQLSSVQLEGRTLKELRDQFKAESKAFFEQGLAAAQ